MAKIVLLLGAGATLSDVATTSRKDRPPLDNRFFSDARLTDNTRVQRVRRYIAATYALDVLDQAHDTLEGVMGQIYTDLFNPLLEEAALTAFRNLIQLFNQRLATTTNGIRPTNKRFLYRIVAQYLARGTRPEDLTIITFNQDIQVEKCLHLMSSVSRWSHVADKVFNFPGLYQLGPSAPPVTAPPGALAAGDCFPRMGEVDGCISLLKLHGSLNWYSTHASATPSTRAMFKPSRRIYVTRRRTIAPAMTRTGGQRRLYTLPVIVPPVSHKSSVLHDGMRELWRLSEQALHDADEIVVFGYSCPPLDFESSNQLRRSQMNRTHRPSVCLIDPDPAIAARYISLLQAECLHYYASARTFINRS